MASETIDITMQPRKVLASGTDDFKKLRTPLGDGYQYVIADKTQLIAELLQNKDEGTLITRPPRFMKTTNLSMLKYFFDIENKDENAKLFEGLAIREEKSYRNLWSFHQGQYPVVFITFKDINSSNYDELCEEFGLLISNLFEDFEDIVTNALTPNQKSLFSKYISRQASVAELKHSFKFLTKCLFKRYQRKVWMLIDEYDTPIQAMHQSNTEPTTDLTDFERSISFFSSLLSSAVKTNNNYLAGSVITGVLRTPFASLISPLNNIERYSVLTNEYAPHFGLTEVDVNYLATELGLSFKTDALDIIKRWYNGYKIGGVTLYNPWSINAFLKRYVKGNKQPKAYWLGSGESRHIDRYFKAFYSKIRNDLMTLMATGDSIDIQLSEQTYFQDLDSGKLDAFWGLLVHCGYLTVTQINEQQKVKINCKLKIPNYEVTNFFAINIGRCHQDILESAGFYDYEKFMRSLVTGDIDYFEKRLNEYILNVASYFDFRKKPIRKEIKPSDRSPTSVEKTDQSESEDYAIVIAPEIIYHAFMLGLLGRLHGNYFKMRSNRESGYGRFDLLLIPMQKEMHGVIFEFKKAETITDLKGEAQSALDQIKEKQYYADLKECGVKKGIHIGISFHGKHFELKYENAEYQPNKAFTPSYSAIFLSDSESSHQFSETLKMSKIEKDDKSRILNEQLKFWSGGQNLTKDSWEFLLPDEDIQMQWALSVSKKEKHSAKTIKQRKEKMITAAKNYGYTCQDVEEDGNCFFHVIANQLNRLGREASDDIDHEVLRTLVAVEVAEHSHYYKDFLAVSEQERHAQKIAEPRVWVGMIAAQAIARIKHVIVVIIPNDGGMPQVMKPPGATEVIVLGNEVGVHFQSLYSETCRAGIPTEALRNIIEATPELTVTQGVITVEQTTRNVAEITTGTTTTTLLATLSDSHLAVTAKSTATPMDIEANKEGNKEEVTTKGPIAPLTSSELSAPTTRKRTRNPEEDTHQAAEPSEQTQTKRAKLG